MPPPARLLFGTALFPLPSTAPCPSLTRSPVFSPSLPVSFPFFPSPRLSSSSPSPAPLHSPAPILFRRPLSPHLLSTFGHWPSSAPAPPSPWHRSAKQGQTEGPPFGPVWLNGGPPFGLTYQAEQNSLCSIKQDRTEALCLVLIGRTESRYRKRERWVGAREWEGDRGRRRAPEEGRCREVGGCWGRERRWRRRRRGGVLGKGEKMGKEGDGGSIREEGVLGKGEETGRCRRGRGEGKRRDEDVERKGKG